MDFTYFVALGLALVIGFVAAVIYVTRGGQSRRKLFGWALLASVAADFALLIDWTYVTEYPLWMFGLDLIFFVIYGLIGCAIGASPVLFVRRLFRKPTNPPSQP
jgi:hypothetical protein